MPTPFQVRDQDDPTRDLGEWTEDGNIRLPGNMYVSGTILGPNGQPLNTGPINDVQTTERAAFFKNTSSLSHTVTIYQAGTTGVDVAAALNVVSDNTQSSAMYLSGTEENRGTLKITHRKPTASDASAAALSIDLTGASTAARGIFLTSTTGGTTGDLIGVRNNSRDDFVVKGTGRVGIGVATAATPGAALDVRQNSDTTKGILVKANSASALGLIEGQNSSATVVFNLSKDGDLAAIGNALGLATPATHGMAAWTYDPALAINSTLLTNGTIYLAKVYVPLGVSITKLYWHVAVVAVAPSAAQNEVGIYNTAGTLLASANVDADVTSTGLKTTTIASTALSTGASYWVAFVFNAATAPTLARTTGVAGAGGLVNAGLSVANYRFATNGTTKTVLDASITPASASQGIPLWAAVGA